MTIHYDRALQLITEIHSDDFWDSIEEIEDWTERLRIYAHIALTAQHMESTARKIRKRAHRKVNRWLRSRT